MALQHRCSSVNLQHVFGKPFPRNTSGWLLLKHNDYVSEAAFLKCSAITFFKNFSKTNRKTPVPGCLFDRVKRLHPTNLFKKRLCRGVSIASIKKELLLKYIVIIIAFYKE